MAPQVNGDAPSSAFLSHILSYPVISDSITTFKSHPYGAKSVALTHSTYTRLSAPIAPYLSTPYAHIRPYISRADSLGDSTLTNLDTRFPAVRKPTGELIDGGKKMVFYPLTTGVQGKEYVWGVWGSEVSKVGGQGVLMYGKAAIATGLVVGSDAVGWLSGWVAGKKQEVKEVSNEKLNH